MATAFDRADGLSELGDRELEALQGYAAFRKRKLGARMSLFHWTGRSISRYYQRPLRPAQGDYSSSIKFYLARCALSGHGLILDWFLHVAGLLKRKNERGSAAK